MNNSPWRQTRLIAVSLFLATASTLCADEAPVDFERTVRPILAAHCFRCHGPDKQESGLRLDRRKSALAGGDGGVAIVPGQSQQSALIQRVTTRDDARRMPPQGDRLSDLQIQVLNRWIDQGASGIPDQGLPSAAERHWAFQPLHSPALPRVADDAWAYNFIDRFLLERLERESQRPAVEARRETLVRRLYLDLIGLPPPWARVAEFVGDDRPDAYERLVDELLASPAFGERWGRHWLDQARYADSSGYEADQPREIWAYRDWVIDALNADQPFDRFIVEQLAGDLLPNATVDERIASGFHCNAMLDPGVRPESVVDQVNTTGAVLLGLTLGCAQCHAHKTDPISQRDFYQLYAFFNDAVPAPMQFDGQYYVPPEKPADAPQDAPAAAKPPTTLVLRHVPQATRIFVRGDPANLGDEVQPGMPSFLESLFARSAQPPADSPTVNSAHRRTRLDLAHWLVAPSNPLPARVTANRIWQQLFGSGLVETDGDFGLQTPPPVQLALLDRLAADFREPHDGAWRGSKSIVRRIIGSATYRQDSALPPDGTGPDAPLHRSPRQRRLRLESELIRDAALAASGLLDRRIGGPSVFPEQADGVLLNRATPATWQTSSGGDRYRRGLYTWIWRLTPHPHATLFDAPDGVTACTRRERSNVPVQALTLLNDPTFVEAAQALARQVVAQPAENDDLRIDWLVRTCLARDPQPNERTILSELLVRQRDELAGVARVSVPANDRSDREIEAWMVVCRVVMNLDEFITRQ